MSAQVSSACSADIGVLVVLGVLSGVVVLGDVGVFGVLVVLGGVGVLGARPGFVT